MFPIKSYGAITNKVQGEKHIVSIENVDTIYHQKDGELDFSDLCDLVTQTF